MNDLDSVIRRRGPESSLDAADGNQPLPFSKNVAEMEPPASTGDPKLAATGGFYQPPPKSKSSQGMNRADS